MLCQVQLCNFLVLKSVMAWMLQRHLSSVIDLSWNRRQEAIQTFRVKIWLANVASHTSNMSGSIFQATKSIEDSQIWIGRLISCYDLPLEILPFSAEKDRGCSFDLWSINSDEYPFTKHPWYWSYSIQVMSFLFLFLLFLLGRPLSARLYVPLIVLWCRNPYHHT